jgi:flagellum-specific peptidoglycan hydrolase FlgJ
MQTTTQLRQYLQRNWFKIGVIIILAFVVFKKDLSFRIHLNNPSPTEKGQQPPQPVQHSVTESSEKFTDNTSKATGSNGLNDTERFDFSTGTSSRKPGLAIDKLKRLDKQKVQKYITRFTHVAENEQEKFGVPASIILANALLQSLAGTNDWASNVYNNQFGLTCTSDWQGSRKEFDGRCMRQYENAWMSFRDHSFFLTTGPNAHLKQLGKADYKSWAQAIEKMNLYQEPKLADQLIQVIETIL